MRWRRPRARHGGRSSSWSGRRRARRPERDADLWHLAAMPLKQTASLMALLALGAAAQAQTVIPLWEKGAPGFEARRDQPEQHKDWWYKNIHNPSLTVFKPLAGKANGAAVIVAAGGGHRELVFNPEGVEPAQYLAKIGRASCRERV